MLSFLSQLVLFIYCISLATVTVYCLMQFHLLYYYKKYHSKYRSDKEELLEHELPYITIQLPIFNELHVVKRLIHCICQLDYPFDKLEVQILDDSTDETTELIRREIKSYQAQGRDIKHIHRENRQGYKAGALQCATPLAKGEFIAIFDADFLPESQFLKQTVKHFDDNKVAVVQSRWEHLNQDYSLLTKVQALQLNVHFTVEQMGRRAGNFFLQFNGTAGLWRKSAIEDAGGWQADTLTEDLDLSYRAQLKGWKIIYLEDVVSPAELPAEINGLKSQQFRWMKGGAETAKKVLPQIWKSNIGLVRKIHASSHLLGSTVFVAVFVLALFSVPLTFLIKPLGIQMEYLTIFLSGLISVSLVYYVANIHLLWKKDHFLKKFIKFLILFPVFLALSMGLSFHNTVAVIQGYMGKRTAFVRTPKFDLRYMADKLKSKKYFNSSFNLMNMGEGILFIYFSAGIFYGLLYQQYTFLLMHILLSLGYGGIFILSLKNKF